MMGITAKDAIAQLDKITTKEEPERRSDGICQ